MSTPAATAKEEVKLTTAQILENDARSKKMIETAIGMIAMFNPLYATIFAVLNKVNTRTMPTMAVGPIRKVDLALFYNPEFVISLTTPQLKAVLKHEALHVTLNHISRGRSLNRKAYNLAADAAINCNLTDLPPNCILPKTIGCEDFKSSDEYYKALMSKLEKADGDEEKAFAGLHTTDDHSMWDDVEEGSLADDKLKQAAAASVKAQEKNGWGDWNGNFVQEIMAANKPVVNWKREVRYFINQIVMIGKKTSRSRPNRRTGIINPGHKKDYTSKILVAFDTSGSVSDAELNAFATELNGLITYVKTDFITFDHQLHGEPIEFSKRKRKYKIVGRGGTSFDPVIALAAERKYDGLIIFTDGYAPYPPKPKGLRVLWALCEQHSPNVQFPYGKKVVIDRKK